MTQTDVSLVIGIATLIISLGGSMFISGMKWGQLRTKVDDMEAQTRKIPAMEAKMEIIGHDMAEIKGMFKLTLKDGSSGQ